MDRGSQRTVLEVKDLDVTIFSGKKRLPAVHEVSFSVDKGRTLGIVGESGSGKSMTALAIMGLLEENVGKITRGSVLLGDTDVTRMDTRQLRSIRGNLISMIFQEPMTSLNPVLTIGFQLKEAIRTHRKMDRAETKERALELLRKVGISLPGQRMRDYPYQLSGGMRQRVMIAMALACRPNLLICDEPTTALDVTIQAQILDLIRELQREETMAVILITHDMGIISERTDSVIVMYAGEIMEYAPTENLFSRPLHPYTIGLMRFIPRFAENREVLDEIPGMVPALDELPPGCPFCDRCPSAKAICREEHPSLVTVGSGSVRCWMHTAAWGEGGDA